MAKININFNDKKYSIDESSLSAEKSKLEQHLSTTMNGTGAVISLGGTAYNIDSAKLTTARNDFTTHLGTIAGNGKKIVIGGVEYSIGSDKVAVAIGELEAVLGGLNSDDSNEDTLPKKNEYGFYYNVPYVDAGESETYAYVFYEDNTMLEFNDVELAVDGLFSISNAVNLTYDEATKTVTNAWGGRYMFAENGEATTDDSGYTYFMSPETVHGIYYDQPYISQDGGIVVCAQDGTSFDLILDGMRNTSSINTWFPKGHYAYGDDYQIYVSMNGNTLVLSGKSNNDMKIYTRKEEL